MTEHRSPRQGAPSPDRATVIDVDFSEVRTGEDVRQRGWFWHWNELHTEYGPLLRQSGIGLLTSYIVYTDRREGSPHRGFAFPSLQLQAAFTGADRAELITINQILVALDLLEIRKEMVTRADEQGRQWRVPHNLYRVKDKSDSRHLTAADVLRVLELAERKREVYRHIRHIFSAGFTPISRGNVWHALREELRETPPWQRLAARAARDEARFSARSRAGHAARKSTTGAASGMDPALEPIPSIEELRGEQAPIAGVQATTAGGEIVPGVGAAPVDGETSVAKSNRGSAARVAPSNEGSDPDSSTMDDPSNRAPATRVAPSNPMYDQSFQTTRTTTASDSSEGIDQTRRGGVTAAPEPVNDAVTEESPALSQVTAPGHGPDRAAALLAFTEANGREASPAEERLLAGIAGEGDGLIGGEISSGWAVVRAAIYEAVDSGSSYVAPKRVREIVRRWLRDGGAGTEDGSGGRIEGGRQEAGAAGLLRQDLVATGEAQPASVTEGGALEGDAACREASAENQSPASDAPRPTPPDRFWVPEGSISSTLLWETIVGELAEQGTGRRGDIEMYLRPARLVGRSGERGFLLEAPNGHARRRIELHWRAELERGLTRLLGGTAWQIEVTVRDDLRRAG